MRNVDVKLKCLLEGIELNPIRVTITTVKNLPPIAEIVLPAVRAVSDIMHRTLVTIFYYDNYAKCWRLWFKGETSGKTYSKQTGRHSRSLSAIVDINYLNDLPARYLDTMDLSKLGGHYEYQFYNIPLKVIAEYTLTEEVKDDFKIDNLDKDLNKGLIEYFEAFLDKAIGEKAWEPYYKNAGERFKIKQNHVLIDSGLFQTEVLAKRASKIVGQIHADASGSDQRVLDSIIKRFEDVGYQYTNITSPGYNLSGQSGTVAKGNVIKSKYHGNALAEHVILPNTLNSIPPKCNVIFADRSVQMRVQIYDNVITRLLNVYCLIEEPNNTAYPAVCAVYPRELSKKALSGDRPFGNPDDKTAFKFLPEELHTGMRPVVQSKSHMYNLLLGGVVDVEGNRIHLDIAKGYQSLFNKQTQHDFYKIMYSRNTLDITMNEFNPYLVCGLPSIVYDVDCDTFYYGIIDVLTQSVDLDQGGCSTSIKLKYVREISDVREIFGTQSKESEDTKERIYKIEKVFPFVPKDVYVPIDGDGNTILDPKGLSSLTNQIYKPFLKGSNENKDKGFGFGWQAVIDETKIKEGKKISLPLSDILPNIKKVYFSKYKKKIQEYVHREITTVYEYYTSIFLNNTCNIENKYKDKAMPTVTVPIKNLSQKKFKIKEKEFYITERQKPVKILRRKLLTRKVTDE